MKFEEFFQRINNVTLKLTAGCNLHCTYCNAEAETPKTPRMPMERYKQIARLLVANSRSASVGL
jgi:sulfatase maturation enzyme AslB (radical SAM superfamily)